MLSFEVTSHVFVFSQHRQHQFVFDIKHLVIPFKLSTICSTACGEQYHALLFDRSSMGFCSNISFGVSDVAGMTIFLLAGMLTQQCPLTKCYFSVGDKCVSQCPSSSCGTTCTTRPIIDARDILYFSNCSLVLGGLSLMNLAPDLDVDALQPLQAITKIAGPLRVIDNQYLTSLSFLNNLTTVESIVVSDNRNLVDARLPRLTPASLAGTITQTLNPRLCPARRVGGAGNATASVCATTDLVFRVMCHNASVTVCTAALIDAANISSQVGHSSWGSSSFL